MKTSENPLEVISKLKNSLENGASIECLEKLLKILAEENYIIIQPLLLCLDDEYEYQEFMWSIVHLVESFDKKTYAAELIKILPILRLKAPDWSETLFIRILNNNSYVLEIAKCFKKWPHIANNITNNIINDLTTKFPGEFDSQFKLLQAVKEDET